MTNTVVTGCVDLALAKKRSHAIFRRNSAKRTSIAIMTNAPINPTRSTDPNDYQRLPQTIAVMPKSFEDGHVIPFHRHRRDQLLYAISGIMRLRNDRQAWIVPPDRAVYIPALIDHTVSMHGRVEMRTLYIDAETSAKNPRALQVIAISNLLRELILALSNEPIEFETHSRADLIAKLIEIELARAPYLALNVPLPKDPRLQRLCTELLANPSDRRTLDAWSETTGASPRTLARLFQQDLAMNFNQWRQRVRFQKAVEALSQNEPVARVAAQCGYQSPSAFTAAFKRATGTSPTSTTSKVRQNRQKSRESLSTES